MVCTKESTCKDKKKEAKINKTMVNNYTYV